MAFELPETADGVRRANAELDERLRALLSRITADQLGEGPDDGWTVAEQLGHIAEFPGYFARQLREWIAGERTVIGRVAEHDADRNDAVVRAPQRSLEELREQAERSFDAFAEALEELEDEHLTQDTHNVKYGTEPLSAFLTRYAVGHKAAHVEQLQATLENA
jgi:uncharacterized damage-inducible protein DinB